jgi:hypothetical protein
MFFQGTRIYSYGTHYCIAELHSANGQRVALVNSNGYSISTAKHTNYTRRALTHLTQFVVPNVSNPQDAENITHLANKVADSITDILRARNVNEWMLNRVNGSIRDFNLYCETFAIQDNITLDAETLADIDAIYREKLEQTNKRDAEKRAKRALERQKEEQEFKESVKAWKLFQGNLKGYSNEVFLRLNVEKNLVETSRGADVPLDQALKLVQLVETKQVKQGFKIGSFEVRELTDTHLVIGCHNIPLTEMRNVFGVNNNG